MAFGCPTINENMAYKHVFFFSNHIQFSSPLVLLCAVAATLEEGSHGDENEKEAFKVNGRLFQKTGC